MSTERPKGMAITPGPARSGSQTYYVHDTGKRYTVVHGTALGGDVVTNCVTCVSFNCPHANLIRTTIEGLT